MNFQKLTPQELTFSAVLVASILTDEMKASEINSLGNWFTLLGQYLETISAFLSQQESELQNINININTQKYRETGNPFQEIDNSNLVLRQEIENIKKIIQTDN